MMFASKTPRDLNHDPKPIRHPSGRRTEVLSFYCEMEEGQSGPFGRVAMSDYDPRPEFDHVQHNAPNPILVEFREEVSQWGFVGIAELAHNLLDSFEHLGITYDEDPEVDHAAKVLTRLANLGEPTS